MADLFKTYFWEQCKPSYQIIKTFRVYPVKEWCGKFGLVFFQQYSDLLFDYSDQRMWEWLCTVLFVGANCVIPLSIPKSLSTDTEIEYMHA